MAGWLFVIVRADTGVCPYSWVAACGPLLLEGGVGGGRDKYGHYQLLNWSSIVVSLPSLAPRPPSQMGICSPLWGRSHIDGCSNGPSRPGGGDHAGCQLPDVRADTGVCPYVWMSTTLEAFFMFFARRRGDFAEMMGVRGEDDWGL